MKVGDLVRLRGHSKVKGFSKDEMPMMGIITELSNPTPTFPFQVASIVMIDDNQIIERISVNSLEVISECR